MVIVADPVERALAIVSLSACVAVLAGAIVLTQWRAFRSGDRMGPRAIIADWSLVAGLVAAGIVFESDWVAGHALPARVFRIGWPAFFALWGFGGRGTTFERLSKKAEDERGATGGGKMR